MYNFRTAKSRRHDGSFKYDAKPMSQDPAVIPMWIADMDFETLPEIVDAIKDRAEFGIFGYMPVTDEFLDSFARWMDVRHGLDVDKDTVIAVPGIVPAIKMLIQALTEPNDEILIFTPVYHPFKQSIEMNGRICVECPLEKEGSTYRLDFDRLEKILQDHSIRMMIFCSPHNPVGKVWDEEDLIRLGELCRKYHVIMVSDEIHMDFARLKKHIPFLKACPDLAQQTILCTAPTKTFNLAGLQVSALIVPNPEYRHQIEETMAKNGMEKPSILAITAAAAAWNHGDRWVDELNDQLAENIEMVQNWIETEMPELKLTKPEGLYLLWIDCNGLNLNPHQLEEFMNKEAKVFMNQGIIFGQEGAGFVRMNVACPPSTLRKALDQISEAWKARKQN